VTKFKTNSRTPDKVLNSLIYRSPFHVTSFVYFYIRSRFYHSIFVKLSILTKGWLSLMHSFSLIPFNMAISYTL